MKNKSERIKAEEKSMENKGTIYVSGNTTKGEFKRFDLRKRSSGRPDLEDAIDFFRERINGRYLQQINMLNRNLFDNGFASMAICCLLIDTFYQFEHGVTQTTNNHVCYVDFLRNHMGDVFDTQEKADRFYVDIRCGILHSAQTKNGSRLSTGQNDTVQYIDGYENSAISVDVKKLEERLVLYFNEYCDRIRYDKTCQSNFVKKLNKMFG